MVAIMADLFWNGYHRARFAGNVVTHLDEKYGRVCNHDVNRILSKVEEWGDIRLRHEPQHICGTRVAGPYGGSPHRRFGSL